MKSFQHAAMDFTLILSFFYCSAVLTAWRQVRSCFASTFDLQSTTAAIFF